MVKLHGNNPPIEYKLKTKHIQQVMPSVQPIGILLEMNKFLLEWSACLQAEIQHLHLLL